MKFYLIFIAALFALFISACGTAVKQTASPTDVVNKYIEAHDLKDVAAAKQTFSKATVKMYESIAERTKVSLDDTLKQQFDVDTTNLKSKLEVVSEKIEGEKATVEMKDKTTNEIEKLPLVKEDGEWKFALDEYIKSILKKRTDDMNKTPTNKN